MLLPRESGVCSATTLTNAPLASNVASTWTSPHLFWNTAPPPTVALPDGAAGVWASGVWAVVEVFDCTIEAADVEPAPADLLAANSPTSPAVEARLSPTAARRAPAA